MHLDVHVVYISVLQDTTRQGNFPPLCLPTRQNLIESGTEDEVAGFLDGNLADNHTFHARKKEGKQ